MAKTAILKELFDALGMKVSVFEKEIGVSNSTIRKSIENDKDLTPMIIANLSKKYNTIRKEWLETGSGEIFEYCDFKPPKQGTTDQQPIKLPKRVPMLGEAAAGNEMEMTYNDMQYPSTEQHIDVGDLLKDSEYAFVVYGNSMTPAYPSGCVLGIRRNYDGFIQPGETYLIVTKSNRLFKRLYYNDDKTGYVCISDNTMTLEAGPRKGKYAYEPFEVKFEDVISIFDVVGMIKRNRNSQVMHRQTA